MVGSPPIAAEVDRMLRRTTLIVAALALAATVLVACQPGSSPNPSESVPSSSPATSPMASESPMASPSSDVSPSP
jgi:hypothetical protein